MERGFESVSVLLFRSEGKVSEGRRDETGRGSEDVTLTSTLLSIVGPDPVS